MTKILSALLGLVGAATLAAPALAQHHDHGGAPAGTTSGWTALPMLRAMTTDRLASEISAINLTAETFAVAAPDGRTSTRPAQANKASVEPDGALGNYHLVSAREETDGHVHVASTVVYFPNPGPAPTAMLEQPRGELEIVPTRLPREHNNYRAGDTGSFVVRADGKPWAGAQVRLETANGTKSRLTANGKGVVEIVFPSDFKPVEMRPVAEHGRPVSSAFVMAVEREVEGRHFLSTFSYRYSPNPFDGKSVWAGAGFALLGATLAIPLLRRRDAKKEVA